MNPAHAHLILNHLPVLGVVFGCCLLAYGAPGKNGLITRIALATFVIAGVFALPTYFTGEPAEEIVEHLPGVVETTIERHEDAAKAATIATALLGVLSLAFLGLSHKKDRVPTMFVSAALLFSLATAGALAWTANLGGEIRHTEIVAPAAAGGPAAAPSDAGGDD